MWRSGVRNRRDLAQFVPVPLFSVPKAIWGCVSNAATIVDATQLTWLKGHDRIKSWIKARGFRSDFCVECGSPVPNLLRDKPYYWVPAGLLDSTGMSEIRIHLHLASKASWEKVLHPASTCDESPSIEQLLKELKRGPDA